ncbi:hypothetical protein JXQ31_02460 [candidate division KSB1 bacterium]|nr:hypothetical protein [candidate division KSB1 bacterium]
MTKIEELEIVVDSLPEEEYRRFRRWFLARDWRKWDKRIKNDSDAGRLDFLKQEAGEAKTRNKLKNL